MAEQGGPSRLALEAFPEVGAEFELLEEARLYTSEAGKKELGKICNLCGDFVEGRMFHCSEKRLDVHHACGLLKNEIVTPEGKIFVLLKEKPESPCNICMLVEQPKVTKLPVQSSHYQSLCGNYAFHVYCLNQKPKSAPLPNPVQQKPVRLQPNSVRVKAPLPNPVMEQPKSSQLNEAAGSILESLVSSLLGDPTGSIVHALFG